MLKEKDVCILIPTYNRPEDLGRLLKSIVMQKERPAELIILDQSKNDKTKNIAQIYFKKNKFIKYKHYKILGKNNALNDALIKIKNKFKIIILIDDDAELIQGFIKEVLKEFNSNSKIMGVGAVDINEHNKFNLKEYNSLKFKLLGFILGFFLLLHKDNHKFKILGPYGNTSTPRIERDIRDCQWISGFIMCYRNEVFDNYRIPERIGYDVSEDIDLGYHVYTKYGNGSLAIPKRIRVYHHYSDIERYPDKKRIFVNHEDHFNFYYRYFYNISGTLKLIWELFWINILNVIRAIIKPKKTNFLKIKYLWQALYYCIKYRKRIKNGESRMFLNEDLSMKDKF